MHSSPARFVGLVAVVAGLAAPAMNAQADEGDWPVEMETARGTVVLYQPQVEAFTGDMLEARGAISLTPPDGSGTIFGAVWFTCRVSTDLDTRTVTLDDLRVSASKFPDVDEAHVAELSAYLEREIPTWDLEISLDRLLATVAAEEGEQPGVAGLQHDPPEIIYAEVPTVLVVIDGDPILANLADSDLKYVANSAYYILKEPASGRFYLKGGDYWYEASDLKGEWKTATNLPGDVAQVAKSIAEEEAKQEEAAEQEAKQEAAESGATAESGTAVGDAEDAAEDLGEAGPAAIVVRTTAAEIIQVSGAPDMVPLEGTSLLYVSNTETDLLFDIDSQRYYVLLAGRWFDSAALENGDWKYTPPDALPADFAKIPEDSDLGQVLFAVAGTQQSREAALENQIPQTAEIDRKTATVTVTYDGDPEFQQCTDDVAYALNTDKSVLLVDGRYYCCDEAVWFVGRGPEGPWDVATEVPPAVQDIPADCPVYNVKYCYIYDSTPEVVYVAYTPGYSGSYVYHGCVVYGTGYWYQPWYGAYYYPRPVTWGFRVHWNPVTGWGFGFGVSYGWLHIGYGRPYYGGWWGPRGYRHGYRHGYHRGYRHGYHRGARAGYRAGYRAGNRSSNRNMYRNRNTGVRHTGGGGRGSPGGNPKVKPKKSQRPNNVYADKKGNVYRDQGGSKGNQQWQKNDNRAKSGGSKGGSGNQGGNWSQSQKAPSSVQRDSQARQRGNNRSQQSKSHSSRSSSRGGSRGGGGGGRRR